MLASMEMIETQLEEWYDNLPSVLSFERPDGDVLTPLNDDLRHIVRNRYLTMREHLYRPFVQICVEDDMASMSCELVEKVAAVAMRGLQYATFRIQIVSMNRHQGLWLAIRSHATYALMLIAINRARQRQDRYGARRVVLPRDWRRHIEGLLVKISPYANERTVGCQGYL